MSLYVVKNGGLMAMDVKATAHCAKKCGFYSLCNNS